MIKFVQMQLNFVILLKQIVFTENEIKQNFTLHFFNDKLHLIKITVDEKSSKMRKNVEKVVKKCLFHCFLK